MYKAEYAAFRMMNDTYRDVIAKAALFQANGVATEAKAVDMATKDFLNRGLNCIEYRDGRRVNIADYTGMAVRTAQQRAYMMGEGEFRKSIGETLIIISRHNTACELCKPFESKVLIDDVYSGGKQSDGDYMLLSQAMQMGLFHPRCRHGLGTYYPELEDINGYETEDNKLNDYGSQQANEAHIDNMIQRYKRLTIGSLDPDNVRKYQERLEYWENQKSELAKDKSVDNDGESGIIISDEKEMVESIVHYIGKIDKEIYSCVTNDIITEDVIITDERIGHIKERHPNDFELYCQFIKSTVEHPDYIIEANKEKTAVVLKSFNTDNHNFKIVIRLSTSTDNPKYKNSVITFMRIDEKDYKRLIKNKKVLYTRE